MSQRRKRSFRLIQEIVFKMAKKLAALHSRRKKVFKRGALNVPRGVLESACEYGYEETVRELVEARSREVVVVCRSGNRSALAAFTMQSMGYKRVVSMKTGLRGWNDYELPLVNARGLTVPVELADEFFTTRLRPDQTDPGR